MKAKRQYNQSVEDLTQHLKDVGDEKSLELLATMKEKLESYIKSIKNESQDIFTISDDVVEMMINTNMNEVD